MRPRRLVGAVALVAVAVSGVGIAHAARLDVAAGHLSVAGVGSPCSTPATATPEDRHNVHERYRDVRFVMPAGCGGDVQLAVLQDGTAITTYVGTVSAGGTVLLNNIGWYTPADTTVAATIDGWYLPTTWAYGPPEPAGPVYAGNAETVTTDLVWTSISNNPVQGCFAVDVSTTSTTPVVWRITMDLAEAPFNGQETGYAIQGPGGVYETYASTPSAGHLQIGGTASGTRRTIVAGQTYHVEVCHWGLPPGVQAPSAYTVSTVRGTWTDTRACLVTTVTGNGTSEFYVGWTVTLDMQSAVTRLQSAGRTFDALTHSGNHWEQTWTPAPGVGPYAYTIVSNSPANIRLSQSYVFETCAVDW